MQTLIVISYEQRQEWDVVRYAGPLNEDTALHLKDIRQAIGAKVIFNFKDVNFVNSSGIRTWVLFIRDIGVGREILFEECSPTVVTQLNMIPGFVGPAKIASVYAPLQCADCNSIESVLFKGPKFPASNAVVSNETCPHCGGNLGLSEAVEEYFEFASRR